MPTSALAAGGTLLRGSYRELVVPSPAAGKEWELLLPGGYGYRVGLAHARFVASAAAANRSPGLSILNGDGLQMFSVGNVDTIVATETWDIGYAEGAPLTPAGTGTLSTIWVPPVTLPAGWTLKSNTHGLAAEDQYSQIRLYLLQLWDVEPGQAAGQHPHHPHIEIDIGAGHAA